MDGYRLIVQHEGSHATVNAYRFTLQIPACVRVSAIGPVEYGVKDSSAPDDMRVNCSTIAAGKILSPSLSGRRS